jgi:hypothetical protein
MFPPIVQVFVALVAILFRPPGPEHTPYRLWWRPRASNAEHGSYQDESTGAGVASAPVSDAPSGQVRLL